MDHKGDLQGCDALAVDPSDTTGNVVWAAMGSDRSTGVILKSANRGKTWVNKVNKSKTQFPCNANGDQGVNERLAVDPVNSSVLYFATRNGLWQTVDDGVSWHKLPGAPLGDQTDIGKDGPCGDRMIVLDPTAGVTGNPVRTKRIYLAPYFAGTGPGTALYESQDGGVSWSAMPGSPSNIENAATRPRRRALLHQLRGCVQVFWWICRIMDRYHAQSRKRRPIHRHRYRPIRPAQHRHGAKRRMFVSRTTAALPGPLSRPRVNQTTMPVDPGWYYDNAVPQHNSHFGWGMFALKFDPFHRGAVWQTDSFLAWHTSNIYAGNVGWQTRIAGHEETVGSMIVSPPSGPALLYSGAADVYGFRHTSLTSLADHSSDLPERLDQQSARAYRRGFRGRRPQLRRVCRGSGLVRPRGWGIHHRWRRWLHVFRHCTGNRQRSNGNLWRQNSASRPIAVQWSGCVETVATSTIPSTWVRPGTKAALSAQARLSPARSSIGEHPSAPTAGTALHSISSTGSMAASTEAAIGAAPSPWLLPDYRKANSGGAAKSSCSPAPPPLATSGSLSMAPLAASCTPPTPAPPGPGSLMSKTPASPVSARGLPIERRLYLSWASSTAPHPKASSAPTIPAGPGSKSISIVRTQTTPASFAGTAAVTASSTSISSTGIYYGKPL